MLKIIIAIFALSAVALKWPTVKEVVLLLPGPRFPSTVFPWRINCGNLYRWGVPNILAYIFYRWHYFFRFSYFFEDCRISNSVPPRNLKIRRYSHISYAPFFLSEASVKIHDSIPCSTSLGNMTSLKSDFGFCWQIMKFEHFCHFQECSSRFVDLAFYSYLLTVRNCCS